MSRIRETGKEYLDAYKENTNENIYKYKEPISKRFSLFKVKEGDSPKHSGGGKMRRFEIGSKK